jgi:hypothetical protein
MQRKQESIESLAELLAELLEAVQNEVDDQDGRDFVGLDCGYCTHSVPLPHSLGCRIGRALTNARYQVKEQARLDELARNYPNSVFGDAK